MANLKPILEELKSLRENINSDSIRDLVLSNLNENREKIESKIKNLADTTKNNPVVNEYLDQILKAELTNQAVSKLQTSFPEHELVKRIVEIRESLIKEANDEVADPTPFASSELEEKLEAQAAAKMQEDETEEAKAMDEVKELASEEEPTTEEKQETEA